MPARWAHFVCADGRADPKQRWQALVERNGAVTRRCYKTSVVSTRAESVLALARQARFPPSLKDLFYRTSAATTKTQSNLAPCQAMWTASCLQIAPAACVGRTGSDACIAGCVGALLPRESRQRVDWRIALLADHYDACSELEGGET